jgi:LysR family glycine cleavage system transcriptional activator
MTQVQSDLPLQSLLLFASAVRHLNFTQVAEEFGTSQPAVSQRIALLEKHLGTALFKRARRGVTPTPEGGALYEAVRGHLAALQEAVERTRARSARPVLTVATDFAFASFWLIPRLQAFQRSAPGIEVRIVTSQNQFDIRDGSVDLAISFGDGDWPGCEVGRLLPEMVLPVCSPALLALHEAAVTPASILRLPLLHLAGSAPTRWMTWRDWSAMQGVSGALPEPERLLATYPLLIQEAIAGRGVALGWRPLVDQLLRDGQLVALAAAPLATERAYFLVRPQDRAGSAALDRLCEWIRQECMLDDGAGTAERAPSA